MTGSARIIRGNALALPLADASVDLICTSPPYEQTVLAYLAGVIDADGCIRVSKQCRVSEANEYVQAVHRHNGPLPAAYFAVAVYSAADNTVRGVAIAGAPKARMLMARGTLEVSRVATDGSRNACSMLYGACKRAAQALGYRRLVTYTLEREAGASLRASGWTLVSAAGGEGWARREASKGHLAYQDAHDIGRKHRWEIALGDPVPDLVWPSSTADQADLFSGGVA